MTTDHLCLLLAYLITYHVSEVGGGSRLSLPGFT